MIERKACISACEQYRYWLSRQWDHGAQRLPFLMLNPSVADASIDDPTIGRCMSFAQREGFGGISVHNLFAFRATKPPAMMAALDPVGPLNDHHLVKLFARSAQHGIPIVAAWGALGAHHRRNEQVIAMAQSAGATLVCLGKTKGGHPRHPLYRPRAYPFEPFG